MSDYKKGFLYFICAVSAMGGLLIWEDSLDTKNLIHCKYMLALGYYGMGEHEKSEQDLQEVEALDCNHLGILQFRNFVRM